MTPNEIIIRAQKKVKTTSTNVIWNDLFTDVIDEIFGFKPWRFSRKEINYIHPQGEFHKYLTDTAEELSINKLIQVYSSLNYGGVPPVPVNNTAYTLKYWPYSDFLRYFPDHTRKGVPRIVTEINENDGLNGMHIGIFPAPTSDAAVWIYADCMPSYVINNSQLPILPRQFHRLVYYGITRDAAEILGQDKLSNKYEVKFKECLGQLDYWDNKNPIYTPRFKTYEISGGLVDPSFPENFPATWRR